MIIDDDAGDVLPAAKAALEPLEALARRR